MNTSKTIAIALAIAILLGLGAMAQAQAPGTVLFWDGFEDDTVGQGPVLSGDNIGDNWTNSYVLNKSWVEVRDTLPAGEGEQYLGVSRITQSSGRSIATMLAYDTENPLQITFQVQIPTGNTWGGQVNSTLDNVFNFAFGNDGSVSAYDGVGGFEPIEGLSHSIDAWNDVKMVLDFDTQLVNLTVNESSAIVPFVAETTTFSMFQFTALGNAAWPGSIAYYDAVKAMVAPLWPGDADKNGTVDELDAAILAEYWMRTGDATWEMGDFNGDNNVDDKDATLMAVNWHHGAPTSVPEPSAAVLLLALVAMLSLWLLNDGTNKR